MRRIALLLATALSAVTVGAVILCSSGVHDFKPSGCASQRGESIDRSNQAESTFSNAMWRYQHNHPHHWRHCLLQH